MTQRIFYALCSILGVFAVFTTVWWPWHWDRIVRDQGRQLAIEAEDWLQRNLP